MSTRSEFPARSAIQSGDIPSNLTVNSLFLRVRLWNFSDSLWFIVNVHPLLDGISLRIAFTHVQQGKIDNYSGAPKSHVCTVFVYQCNNNTKGKTQKIIILNIIIFIVYSDVVIESIHNYQSLFKHIFCLLPLHVMPICRD